MKSQAPLRLRQVGKHHGTPEWAARFGVWGTLRNAFEMNVWPRHYANDEPPPAYYQMTNYLTGERTWYGPVVIHPELRTDTWEYWDAHNH